MRAPYIHDLSDHPTHPRWYAFMWGITFWVMATLALMMLVPDYAALWALLMLVGTTMLAVRYHNNYDEDHRNW